MATRQMYTALLLIIAFTVTITAAGLKEVCQWETFEAKCQDDEVIVIKEAHYGRMGVGRCQPRDFGFAGCSADVSAIMHSRCSGRKYCSVQVPDAEMFAATPCPKDLVTYLQADYECIKVAKHTTDNCDDQILTALSGDIAKPLTTTNSYVCPQRILAQPGQTVNVYLYDFYSKDTDSDTIPECITYGYMSEDGITPTKICGGQFRENNLIYSSDHNMVDIALLRASSHSNHYLLHYEIIGCPTIQAPKNGWVKIQDNTAVVMCNFSHIASELVCSGNEWIGDVHNCTHPEQLMGQSLSLTSLNNIVANTSMFVVMCVAILCGIIFMFGLLAFIKARSLKPKQIPDFPETAIVDIPDIHQNEKSLGFGDQYQPVYAPTTLDQNGQYVALQQNNLYEAPRPGALSTLRASHLPAVENTYGPLPTDHIAPVHMRNQAIYNITGLTLGRDNVVTMDAF